MKNLHLEMPVIVSLPRGGSISETGVNHKQAEQLRDESDRALITEMNTSFLGLKQASLFGSLCMSDI